MKERVKLGSLTEAIEKKHTSYKGQEVVDNVPGGSYVRSISFSRSLSLSFSLSLSLALSLSPFLFPHLCGIAEIALRPKCVSGDLPVGVQKAIVANDLRHYDQFPHAFSDTHIGALERCDHLPHLVVITPVSQQEVFLLASVLAY